MASGNIHRVDAPQILPRIWRNCGNRPCAGSSSPSLAFTSSCSWRCRRPGLLFSRPVVPVVAIVFAVRRGLFLDRVHVDLAHVVWQIGLSTAVVLAALTFQRRSPCCRWPFSRSCSPSSWAGPWGRLAWLLVTALVAAVLRDGGVEGFTLAYAVAIVFAGAGRRAGWAAIGNL